MQINCVAGTDRGSHGSLVAVQEGPAPGREDDLREIAARALELGRAASASGTVARYIPELGNADPACVALSLHTVDGLSVDVGDVETRFTLQSTSKVFSLAARLAAEDEALWTRVRMEPSGDAFHSIVRLEEEGGRPRNPLINAGAIVVSDRLAGATPIARIDGLRTFLQHASGSGLATFDMDEAVYESERRTGFRNRALANYMKHFGVVDDPEIAVDTYFRQCALTADVRELARLALFLAAGGIEPVTRRIVLPPRENRRMLALMVTCGLYDEVGDFAVRVGIPAKSGVSGAILAVVPGRMAIACLGPALGPRGNSVAGIAMLEHLAQHLDLSLFGGAQVP